MIIPAAIRVNGDLRTAWREGRLHRLWAARYPALFDADDIRLAAAQHSSGAHFSEWVTAIELFRRSGYFSLVEKYEFGTAPAKAAALARLGIQIVREPACQHPDLLVYDAAGNWEFVEVKGAHDRLSPRQIKGFPAIEARYGKKIKMLKLVEK
jgi:hypothetical protein